MGGAVILKGDGKIESVDLLARQCEFLITDIVLEVVVTWTGLSMTDFHWHGDPPPGQCSDIDSHSDATLVENISIDPLA